MSIFLFLEPIPQEHVKHLFGIENYDRAQMAISRDGDIDSLNDKFDNWSKDFVVSSLIANMPKEIKDFIKNEIFGEKKAFFQPLVTLATSCKHFRQILQDSSQQIRGKEQDIAKEQFQDQVQSIRTKGKSKTIK